MKEANANLWTYPADVRLITTNGDVNRFGRAVMGRGCAYEAKVRYPDLDEMLGFMLQTYGNKALILKTSADGKDCLWSYPVKHHWRDQADIKLIEFSARKVSAYADRHQELFGFTPRIVMPRPGCGNGRLDWKDVKAVIADLLDDRFTVVHLEPKPV